MAGRTAAIESSSRKGDGARQAMERAVRQTVATVAKLKKKGKYAEAAATAAGFVRHPDVRCSHCCLQLTSLRTPLLLRL